VILEDRYRAHLDVGEGGARVMTQAADHVAGVAVIVRVATEWRVEAQLAALVGRTDVLIHGIHGLQDTAGQLFKFAQLHWFLHAMVLQVVHPLDRLKGARAGDRQSVHVRKLALLAGVDVIGGSETIEEEFS